MERNLLSLFHILVVSAVFIYVGIIQKNTPKMMYWIFLVVGTIIVLYHSYECYTHYMDNKSIWVNLLHILVVGPILIYIGTRGEQTPILWYEILLMLGFASLGYHGYYLVKSFM
jgi:uncharacterized membrane protein